MIEIDVRPVPPPERHPRIFSTFAALAPGDALHLVNDHDPRPLLFTFQREHAGRYDWSYLQEGPETFRVRIGKRPPSRERVLTVCDHLGFDHDRLDALLGEAVEAAAAGRWEAADSLFDAFQVGLRRHIRAEEELLFPLFEQVTGVPRDAGPTLVMREEHHDIERELARMGASLARREGLDPSALVGVLGPHNEKEEHVVYPTVDHALDPDALARLCLDLESV